MNLIKKISLFSLILISTVLANLHYNMNKINFWNTAKRGTNFMNEIPTKDWFKETKEVNIKWVRLVYDKWQTESKDFLLGNTDNYEGLIQKDLEKIKQVLSWSEIYGLKIVITPLSLPGCRWSQNNNNQYDSRIWNDYKYQDMALNFWNDLAKELKSYNCVVAYDILNEPYPEIKTEIKEQTKIRNVERFLQWYTQNKNTPRDLYSFYNKIITTIRKIDNKTPIMIESGFYAQPASYYEFPDKFKDNNILYSVHMYEPYNFTSNENFKNGAKYSYPGLVLFGEEIVLWNKDTIVRYFEPFENWIKINNIPLNKIVVSEFGCMRKNPGTINYLEDIISYCEDKKFHWAFYAFREDGWDGYDYEIGTETLPWDYKAKERGEIPIPPRINNPLFDVIKRRLKE